MTKRSPPRKNNNNNNKTENARQNSLDVTIFLVFQFVTSAAELFAIGEAHNVAGAIIQTVGYLVATDGRKSATARTNAASIIIALLRLLLLRFVGKGSWKDLNYWVLAAAHV